jgi:hypothetical protein
MDAFDDTALIAEINSVINPETSDAAIDGVMQRLAQNTRLDADHAMTGTSLFRQMFSDMAPTMGPASISGLFPHPFTESEEYREWQALQAVRTTTHTNVPLYETYLSPQRHRTLYSHKQAPLHSTQEFVFNAEFSNYAKEAKGPADGKVDTAPSAAVPAAAAAAAAAATTASASTGGGTIAQRLTTASTLLHPRSINGWGVSALNFFLYSDERASTKTLDEIMAVIGHALGVVMSVEFLPTSCTFSRSKVALEHMVPMYDYWRYHFGDPEIKTVDAPTGAGVCAWWVVRKAVVSTAGGVHPPIPPPKPVLLQPPQQPLPKPAARPASPPPATGPLDVKHGGSGGAAAAAAAAPAPTPPPPPPPPLSWLARQTLLNEKRSYALSRFAHYRSLKLGAEGGERRQRVVWRIEPHLTTNGAPPSYGLDLKTEGSYGQIFVGRVARIREPTAALPTREHTHRALFPRRLDWYPYLLNLPTLEMHLDIDSYRARASAVLL